MRVSQLLSPPSVHVLYNHQRPEATPLQTVTLWAKQESPNRVFRPPLNAKFDGASSTGIRPLNRWSRRHRPMGSGMQERACISTTIFFHITFPGVQAKSIIDLASKHPGILLLYFVDASPQHSGRGFYFSLVALLSRYHISGCELALLSG